MKHHGPKDLPSSGRPNDTDWAYEIEGLARFPVQCRTRPAGADGGFPTIRAGDDADEMGLSRKCSTSASHQGSCW